MTEEEWVEKLRELSEALDDAITGTLEIEREFGTGAALQVLEEAGEMLNRD